jgi:hypothetical protein
MIGKHSPENESKHDYSREIETDLHSYKGKAVTVFPCRNGSTYSLLTRNKTWSTPVDNQVLGRRLLENRWPDSLGTGVGERGFFLSWGSFLRHFLEPVADRGIKRTHVQWGEGVETGPFNGHSTCKGGRRRGSCHGEGVIPVVRMSVKWGEGGDEGR